jgi:hypothetical protein
MNQQKILIRKASNVLSKAMFNDDLHVYFFPKEKNRLKKIQYMYQFILYSKFSQLFTTSDNIEGLLIWEEPNKKVIFLY